MSQPDEKNVGSLPPEAGKFDESARKAAPKGDKAGPGHSDIFERLSAGDKSDLIGLVAYGLYQRRKRAWIKDFHNAQGRYPSWEERKAYAFSYRGDALGALRSEAENTMAEFAETVVEEQITELRADALSVQTQAVLSGIDQKIERLGRYRHHIIGHLAGFLILVALVALGTLIINFEPTVHGVYNSIFGGGTKGTAQ